MDLKEMRDRLAAIVAQLDTLKALENIGDDEAKQVDDLYNEFQSLSAKISTAEKLEAVAQASQVSARKVQPSTYEKVQVTPSQVEMNGGFKNGGEFLKSVRKAAYGEFDKRFQNAMFERNGEDGGFLVPEVISSEISKKQQSDDALLPKTRQIAVSGNNLRLPVDESSPWSGGVLAYWTAEGATMTESQNKFGMASWTLNKLAALIKVSDELLEDTVALESYIRQSAPDAIKAKINDAIIAGNGVGKPQGILGSGFKLAVPKESGQAADTVVAANVIKMYSRLLPASRAKAAWYINPQVEEQLRQMVDPNGNYLYIAPGGLLNQTPFGTLMGLPVIPMLGSMPQLGDEGDIMLADLSYYYSIVKTGGVKGSISTHLLFDKDQTAFKFTFRVDGGCPFKSPVSTQFGNYTMSGFITLADRA